MFVCGYHKRRIQPNLAAEMTGHVCECVMFDPRT